MGKRFPFGLPLGWFVVAASNELRSGRVLARRYFGRELAIYRTRSGVVSVVNAHCPHMGAHLGRVGHVDGEVLRCGFHGFKFDTAGTCVATAYGSPPPFRARLTKWEVREQNGYILVWFHPEGESPEWEVPVLEDRGWTPPRWKRYRIATHPQEITENSVDAGHFTQLHGFIEGSINRQLEFDGHYSQSSYKAWRPYGLPGRKPFYKFPVEYRVKVWGLGYSFVNVEIGLFGLEVRVWVLPVPIDEEHVDLIIGLAVPAKFGPLAPLLRFIVHRIVCGEVDQDLDIWSYKAFVERPALAKGDGPIATYRKWAQQFYPTISRD